MANIINNNFHNLKLLVNNDEYWDFFINKDNYALYCGIFEGSSLYDKCLISYIDTENSKCISGDLLYSTDDYIWENAVVSNYELKNVGYTGVDNGLVSFEKDKITNADFLKIYQDSTYEITEDARLKLHAVSGNTKLYEYPLTVEENVIKLNGGFYQGFFKTDCDKYAILPSILSDSETWDFEFVLNKTEFEKESDKTLNDKYPNNKGIFFFIGTRAENKWIYLYDDEDENSDDSCLAYGIGNYVDGGEINKWEYKINNFLDVSIDFPDDEEEHVMENYLSYKYYSPSVYEEDKLNDDYFLDDFIDIDDKPKIIDEENLPSKVLGWCCGYTKENEGRAIRLCCGCGNCKTIYLTEYEQKYPTYMTKCTIFGDDYLSDIDDIEYETEFVENDIDISNFEFITDGGFSLKSSGQYYIDTDNKFLLFDRTCSGFKVWNWEEGTVARYYSRRTNFTGNLFLLMNRTCTRYTVQNIDELRNSSEYAEEYNIYKDLYNNALAFRITDKGEIGYRYLTLDCETETKTTIKEGYSKEGIIKENTWHEIHVKIDASVGKMQMRFYVDGNLVFVTDWMDKLDLRKLYELEEKQETVPYNISLGGGTQGLADVILPNYMLEPYRVYPLEESFAGTFIGYVKVFRFFNCSMEHMNIVNNFKYDINKLK